MSIEISNIVIMRLILIITVIISVCVIAYLIIYMRYVLKIIDRLDKIPCTNDYEYKKFKIIRKVLRELKNPMKQIRKISNEYEDKDD